MWLCEPRVTIRQTFVTTAALVVRRAIQLATICKQEVEENSIDLGSCSSNVLCNLQQLATTNCFCYWLSFFVCLGCCNFLHSLCPPQISGRRHYSAGHTDWLEFNECNSYMGVTNSSTQRCVWLDGISMMLGTQQSLQMHQFLQLTRFCRRLRLWTVRR